MFHIMKIMLIIVIFLRKKKINFVNVNLYEKFYNTVQLIKYIPEQ